jgi:4'-phosphopantetheinyl transferase
MACSASISAGLCHPANPMACRAVAEPGNGWLRAPEHPVLAQDVIHVWRAPLDLAAPLIEDLRRTLSDDELNRAERFVYVQDRERFIAARGLLRIILGRYLGLSPERLRFRYGPWGKPELAAKLGCERLTFNLSHSRDLALYAVSRKKRVGIDLEHVRPIPEFRQLVERYFSSSEKAVFRALSPDGQMGAFFRGWTRKEAYIKARGQGFALALDRFDVSIAPGEPARVLTVGGDSGEASRWSVCELLPAGGYVAALAAEGQDLRLACWQWVEEERGAARSTEK